MTDAEKLDVRSEIASIAGVSVGNVTKVKQLVRTAHPDVLQALRDGGISIHRAWLWSKETPNEQREALWLYQGERGVKKAIRSLVHGHQPKSQPVVLDLDQLFDRLSSLESNKVRRVQVAVIDAPGETVFITDQLFQTLGAQGEIALT